MRTRSRPEHSGEWAPDDHLVSRSVRHLLLICTMLSAALLLLGLLIGLSQTPQNIDSPPQLDKIFLRAIEGRGTALIHLGLLVLMLAPAMEVAMLAYGHARIGRWRFAVVSVVVLFLLGLGLALGTRA